MEETVLQKAQAWTRPPFDNQTRLDVQNMIEKDPHECMEAFYKNLEFGTGGLRGLIGMGTNRMNIYTVAMASQGFANYLTVQAKAQKKDLKVAISYDCRNFSKEFALATARVFTGNGFIAYLFEQMRPTPELSFAVRHLNCCGGVMITASHNPKEYNGYKAYGYDGGQLVYPHDEQVIQEVEKIGSYSDVKMSQDDKNIFYINEDLDTIYLEKVKTLSLSPQAIKRQKDLCIVYTPLHGTGRIMVPKALKDWGFENVNCVEEQMEADGNFSTVASPNPEERLTMKMAIDKAKSLKADLVLATDPDGDRVGVAIADGEGDYILLNGNMTASVLIYYLIRKYKELGRITGKEYIVKTIVTTELLKDIALKNGVKSYDVLTGFKYIAELLAKLEGKEHFIGGGEESYGYLAGDFVRDKDAVIACCIIAEMAAEAADRSKNFMDILQELYKEYGFYKEDLVSITKKGMEGLAQIKSMMGDFRAKPPQVLGSQKVIKVIDYLQGYGDLPAADIIQFYTEDGSKITIRPSGTEPKIKFYFSIKSPWRESEKLSEQEARLEKQIELIKKDLIK